MIVVRWLLALLAAVLVTAVLGSIAQTQVNLARIEALDGSIGLYKRLEVTVFDLVSFAPLYAVIVALALLIAMLVAGFLVGRLRRWPGVLFSLAGLVAIACTLVIMNAMLPVTLIAAAREWAGFLALCLAGAVGGWMYYRIWIERRRKGTRASTT